MKIKDFIQFYESLVPVEIQEDWDNSGFQLGNRENDITGILISLDFSLESVEYASKNNMNLIFTHHPVFYKSINNLEKGTKYSDAIIKAVKNDISVYSSHTNLDFIEGGVNDTLANLFNINDINPIIEHYYNNKTGLGRYGYIFPLKGEKFINFLKNSLNEQNVIVYGNLDKEIIKVGVVGGTGAETLEKSVELNLDVLITSDIKYHQAEFAVENNLTLIDIGHYNSEKFVLDTLYNIFSNEEFKNIIIEKFVFDKSKRKIL
ncbi:Nif3-like dinuclear metal center hexameric protein [Miniphocaeibacter massiliensis]|uniref:Nif3-like dinuclear metal center hexameric protein n=1 Tax=Miniphocaeibacter massiliensis TaxID=2041841 RepID=UPI0013EE3AB9|nr:Nif3-like dinuclear metal center hexameric protein [Miniphocaeibacter massiliensis]